MENLVIRKATINDLDALRRFEQGVIAAERPFDATIKREPTTYYNLAAMITDPQVELLVAESDGRSVGSGYARIESAKPYLQHRQYAYLGFMYVEPEFRGKGVNKAIIEALEDWAIKKGVFELRLEVYAENYAAIKAYEKTGFSGLSIQMRKGLN